MTASKRRRKFATISIIVLAVAVIGVFVAMPLRQACAIAYQLGANGFGIFDIGEGSDLNMKKLVGGCVAGKCGVLLFL